MPRNFKIFLGALGVMVLIGLISLRSLHKRVVRLSEMQAAEERARREVLAPPIVTATDVKTSAQIFWAVGSDKIAPVTVEVALSADPVQRARQVLHELMEDPPTPQQRTTPPDATLLAFYILPDGTAIADFSDSMASDMPSGIMSEAEAVNSIVRTLAINVPSIRRLKILIHGQEVDTLAGHVDLTGYFDVNPNAPLGQALPSASNPSPGVQPSSGQSKAPAKSTR
ncbi:MAG TPA: GerMN domain-containing protein [Candidatus Acidoferrales bacterium]|nr:GerMN domain-containing protein [Candidatus Acidoferrales bacterium]